MELKVGLRLRSRACLTAVMVVRAPGGDVDLRCGGHPMQPLDADDAASLMGAFSTGTAMGKRYVLGDVVEVLCTSPGDGTLSVGEEILSIKDAKSLPTSD